jgi:hypothetical protein
LVILVLDPPLDPPLGPLSECTFLRELKLVLTPSRLMVKVAAWVKSLEPVYSKSGNFEALDFQNLFFFAKKIYMTARAKPGEHVVLISPKKTSVLNEDKSFKVASYQVGARKISPGRCDLDSWVLVRGYIKPGLVTGKKRRKQSYGDFAPETLYLAYI